MTHPAKAVFRVEIPAHWAIAAPRSDIEYVQRVGRIISDMAMAFEVSHPRDQPVERAVWAVAESRRRRCGWLVAQIVKIVTATS